jgi:Flp pilus assembly protein TadD
MYCGLAGAWALFLCAQALSADRGAWAGYSMDVRWTDYARTQPAVILHYLRLLFWPRPLVLDYNWQPVRSVGEALPDAAIVGGLAAASVFLLVKRPQWGFLGAWFFLILAPSSSVLPIADLAFLHRMYLPSVAVAAVVVLGAHAAGRAVVRRQWLSKTVATAVGVALASAVAVALATESRARNADFGSDVSIWTDTVAKVPHNPRAQLNLGVALAAHGNLLPAITHYRKALALRPEYAEAHRGLGLALVGLGRMEEAEAHFREVIRLKPDSMEAYNNLGNIVAGRGRKKEAVGLYETALRLKPENADTHNNLGIALVEAGRVDEGIAHIQQALRLSPGRPDFIRNLDLARSLAFGTGGR